MDWFSRVIRIVRTKPRKRHSIHFVRHLPGGIFPAVRATKRIPRDGYYSIPSGEIQPEGVINDNAGTWYFLVLVSYEVSTSEGFRKLRDEHLALLKRWFGVIPLESNQLDNEFWS